MSRFHSYISSALKIIEEYKGDEPFVHRLRKNFTANKKFGSQDRRYISSLCYAYFRAAHALEHKSPEDKMIYSFYLAGEKKDDLIAELNPELYRQTHLPLSQKIQVAKLDLQNIFPQLSEVSPLIEAEAFLLSFLNQPRLFIRSRLNKSSVVEQKLGNCSIDFEKTQPDCFALNNATKLEDIFAVNREVVIQDSSSQRVLDYLKEGQHDKPSAWDCCAASGGKSILLFDRLNGKLKLTVSDIRSSILNNCRERLKQAGINIQKGFVADLTLSLKDPPAEKFNIIICDAPCTGSGTWGRSPEQLSFFKKEELKTYVKRQKSIAVNAFTYLCNEGLFFYVTCSVFKQENEEVVKHILAQTNSSILHQEYLHGYQTGADTMFVAVLSKLKI